MAGLPTCIHLEGPQGQVLLDCGAAVLPGLSRHGLDPARLDAIVLSHLHGDHFAGVPFALLEASFGSPRTRPLVVAGPGGHEIRIRDTLELLFPGAWRHVEERVPLRFVELPARQVCAVGPTEVVAFPVEHPSGSRSFALRVTMAGRAVGFSGDTEWTETLLDVARDADLFICECSSFERRVPYHLSYRTIQDRLPHLAARRIVLTHLGTEMIARLPEVELECAADDLTLHL